MSKQDLRIIYKRKVIGSLNPDFVEKQGITNAAVKKLKKLHGEKESIFEQMEATDDKVELRELVKGLQEVEFKMQEAWGFYKDVRYHSWWYRAPKCSCPKMDNAEKIGTGFSIITAKCVLHGEES
jgi:hypothetical protein